MSDPLMVMHGHIVALACERDEAEAVVRLLVETGAPMCWALHETPTGRSRRCISPPDHDGAHGAGFGGPEQEPSPWTPDLLAALERITSGSAGTEGTTP